MGGACSSLLSPSFTRSDKRIQPAHHILYPLCPKRQNQACLLKTLTAFPSSLNIKKIPWLLSQRTSVVRLPPPTSPVTDSIPFAFSLVVFLLCLFHGL